jgi:hypothetical protein
MALLCLSCSAGESSSPAPAPDPLDAVKKLEGGHPMLCVDEADGSRWIVAHHMMNVFSVTGLPGKGKSDGKSELAGRNGLDP